MTFTNKICIICKSGTTTNQWYRGPKCASCYHNNHYLSDHRKFGMLQKWQRGKHVAKRRLIPYLITREEYKDILKNGCFYCSKDLYKETGHSMDRVDGNLAYTLDNIVPCCGNCNTIKNSILTQDETMEVLKLIKKLRNTSGTPW